MHRTTLNMERQIMVNDGDIICKIRTSSRTDIRRINEELKG